MEENMVGKEASLGLPSSTPATPDHPGLPPTQIEDQIQMEDPPREALDGASVDDQICQG
jgi:hypothetical protein